MSFPEEKLAITQILRETQNPVVVELGAQTGEDVEWMLEAIGDRKSLFVMVEADPVNFEKLKDKFQGPHLYFQCAIADHDGTCDFWRGRILEGPQYEPGYGSGFGSIYEPLDGMSLRPQDFDKIDPVPCFTFDSIFKRFGIVPIDLLRADIHGAEKDMIRFGQEALRYTRYLFIEFWETPIYRGMATRTELLCMLPGWTVLKQFPWNLLLRNESWGK